MISQKVFIKSFCKSQIPHKSVNLSFIVTNIQRTPLLQVLDDAAKAAGVAGEEAARLESRTVEVIPTHNPNPKT